MKESWLVHSGAVRSVMLSYCQARGNFALSQSRASEHAKAITQMNRHAPQELHRIFQGIAGERLWVPVPPGGTRVAVGPLALVYLRWKEVYPEADISRERYWETLQRVPRIGALGVLALINNLLALAGQDIAVHRSLNERFFSEELKARVAEFKLEQPPPPARPAIPVVFNRIGCLLLMRQLIVYGANLDGDIEAPVENIGELALFANEFAQRDTLPSALDETSGELPLQFVPIWDIYNPGDLGYALPRMFTILTEILPGVDKEVRKLTKRLDIEPSVLKIGGLGLVEFISVVFGLYALGSRLREVGRDAVIFDYKRAFEKAPAILPSVEKFLGDRSLTLTEYSERFGGEKQGSRQALFDELKERSFLASGLNTFRHFPLLRLPNTRAVILDLQFLVDLVTSGIYWTIFDGLPHNQREVFQQLRGRLLELYATGLLQEFYPPLAGFLKSDIVYQGGQVDALLDFPDSVIVLEMKSSLLSESAKRLGDLAAFENQVNLKFVRNEEGKPKAIIQLVKSSKAIAEGDVPTTTKPARIYPVLVGEEAALQAFGFNTYLNSIFQKELVQHPSVRPLTVMTIGELEEILPYVSKNTFSWVELFETRFSGDQVIGHSVHQAMMDWRNTRGVAPLRNEVILRRSEQILQKMKETYQFQS